MSENRSSVGGLYVRIRLDALGETWRVAANPGRKWDEGFAGECFVCGWMTFDHQHASEARALVVQHLVYEHDDICRGVFMLNELRRAAAEKERGGRRNRGSSLQWREHRVRRGEGVVSPGVEAGEPVGC